MVGAVVEFVRKKHARFVGSVKILIFQTVMVTEFHKSMKKREGEEVEGKSVLTWLKGILMAFTDDLLAFLAVLLIIFTRRPFSSDIMRRCITSRTAQ